MLDYRISVDMIYNMLLKWHLGSRTEKNGITVCLETVEGEKNLPEMNQ